MRANHVASYLRSRPVSVDVLAEDIVKQHGDQQFQNNADITFVGKFRIHLGYGRLQQI